MKNVLVFNNLSTYIAAVVMLTRENIRFSGEEDPESRDNTQWVITILGH